MRRARSVHAIGWAGLLAGLCAVGAAGEIRAKSFNLNGAWSPFYTRNRP